MKLKTSIWTSLAKNTGLVVLATFMILAFDSCARKVSFLSSSVVPAARGTVKVKKDKNNNYSIQVQLTNLAEVSRLEPPKQTYVVWMEAAQQVMNIGKINSSSSLLSSKLKASFETVSSSKPSKIFITAEDDATVQYPGSHVVLSTESF